MFEPLIDQFLRSLKIISSTVEEISVLLLGKYADCLAPLLFIWLLTFSLVIMCIVELSSQYQ